MTYKQVIILEDQTHIPQNEGDQLYLAIEGSGPPTDSVPTNPGRYFDTSGDDWVEYQYQPSTSSWKRIAYNKQTNFTSSKRTIAFTVDGFDVDANVNIAEVLAQIDSEDGLRSDFCALVNSCATPDCKKPALPFDITYACGSGVLYPTNPEIGRCWYGGGGRPLVDIFHEGLNDWDAADPDDGAIYHDVTNNNLYIYDKDSKTWSSFTPPPLPAAKVYEDAVSVTCSDTPPTGEDADGDYSNGCDYWLDTSQEPPVLKLGTGYPEFAEGYSWAAIEEPMTPAVIVCRECEAWRIYVWCGTHYARASSVSSDPDNLIEEGSDNGAYLSAATVSQAICATQAAKRTLAACLISAQAGNKLQTGSDGLIYSDPFDIYVNGGSLSGSTLILTDTDPDTPDVEIDLSDFIIYVDPDTMSGTGTQDDPYTLNELGTAQSLCGDSDARAALANCLVAADGGLEVDDAGHIRVAEEEETGLGSAWIARWVKEAPISLVDAEACNKIEFNFPDNFAASVECSQSNAGSSLRRWRLQAEAGDGTWVDIGTKDYRANNADCDDEYYLEFRWYAFYDGTDLILDEYPSANHLVSPRCLNWTKYVRWVSSPRSGSPEVGNYRNGIASDTYSGHNAVVIVREYKPLSCT